MVADAWVSCRSLTLVFLEDATDLSIYFNKVYLCVYFIIFKLSNAATVLSREIPYSLLKGLDLSLCVIETHPCCTATPTMEFYRFNILNLLSC